MSETFAYELLEELGRGGMGVVYRARHTPTGAVRAVKVLAASVAPEAVARFRREAEALARVGGDGVVAIHEVGTHGGRQYFAMPYLEGGSLRARLRTGGLPWREAAALVASLARTLGRCHDQGIVHRDVKPENVLLDGEGRPWLADFGIARDLAGASLTMTGATVGTPGYMAPEHLAGGAAGVRSDVFSLGVLLFEAIAGRRPFAGATALELAAAMRRGPPALEGAPTLAPVLAKALAFDPAARFAGAEALAAALDRALAGGGESRHHWGWLVVGLAAAAGAAAFTLRGASPAAAPVPPPAPARPRGPPPPPPPPPADAPPPSQGLENVRQEKHGKRPIWVATLRTPRSRIPLDLVYVPPGTFTAGKAGQNPDETSRPATVARGFWIGRTEVPATAFEDYENARGIARLPGAEPARDVPLVDVSWLAAHLFLEWLGARFPTETEWEWAARGDGDRDFPWNDGAADPGNVAHGATGEVLRSRSYPQDVSPFGLFDVAGNVSEWCQEESTRGRAVDADARRVARARNFRGGSYRDELDRAKLWRRHGAVESDGDHRLGLRVVKDTGPTESPAPSPPVAAAGVSSVTLRPLPWRRAAWVGSFALGPKRAVEVSYVPPCVMAIGQRHGRARPLQQIPIEAGFWIARTETTIEAWQLYLESTNPAGVRKPDPSKLHHPIAFVSLDEVRGFLEWAGVRLPTEAEWELAARSRDGRSFPWGEAFAQGVARVKSADGRNEGPAPVASRPLDVSPFGLFDVAGNVHEWVDEPGELSATRMLKGGACGAQLEYARLWLSRSKPPERAAVDVGFRFVVGRARTP